MTCRNVSANSLNGKLVRLIRLRHNLVELLADFFTAHQFTDIFTDSGQSILRKLLSYLRLGMGQVAVLCLLPFRPRYNDLLADAQAVPVVYIGVGFLRLLEGDGLPSFALE